MGAKNLLTNQLTLNLKKEGFTYLHSNIKLTEFILTIKADQVRQGSNHTI